MTRLPMTLSAMALILSLAACGGGGNGGSIASSTPLNNGGSDADKDGDVLKPGGVKKPARPKAPEKADNTDNETDGGETGGSEPTTNAVAALATELAANEDFRIDVRSSIKSVAKDPLAVARLDLSDEGDLVLSSDKQSGNVEILRITQADIKTTKNGMGIIENGDKNLSGKLSVLGEGLDHTVFGYWALESANTASTFDDLGTIWGGEKTLAEDLPTGTATYAGKAVAVEYGTGTNTLVNELSGGLTAKADFGTMNFSADMMMKTADGSEWGTISTKKGGIPIGGKNVNEDLSSFGGTFVSSKNHSGFGKGQFNGLNAAEVVGSFGINDGMTDGTSIRGAFGGKKQ